MSTQLPVGPPQPERADAARNRQLLLTTARELLTDGGPDCLTMDRLAERSGLGKGTVFRRFGTRAGIFQALLDDAERGLQQAILSGPPPLGPGAPPADRLVAYGRARIRFLTEHREIARAALGVRRSASSRPPTSQTHIRVLLRALDPPRADVEVLAAQLAAALDVPLVLQVSAEHDGPAEQDVPAGPDRHSGSDQPARSDRYSRPGGPMSTDRIEAGWCYLVEQVCAPAREPEA